ncbi:hypothetical protein SAT01_22460 [Sinomonas atrocyanea]|nr:hypothetical protein SAT01_22460 [Sinomonas atrocyanea]GGG55453.1 hypothetical protein GCM10007172_03030 [Sinomonas atrocyanea]
MAVPDELSFTSRRPAVLGGLLALDPTALDTARGVAEALEAFADFDAYSAAMRAFLVDRCAQLISEEPLEGRDGQPARLNGDIAHAVAVSEVALLQGTSEAAAARTVNFSQALVGRHPAVHEALLSGDLTEAHARIIVEQASTLPQTAAELFGIEALGRLRTRKGHRRTPSELRRNVLALRERLHPESITRRRTHAETDRGVWLRSEDDGMCTLTALLPAEIGMAAFHRIDVIANSAHKAEGEYRTTPQLRADAFARALLEAGGTTERPALATHGAGPSPVAVPSPEGLADLLRPEIVVHIPAAVLLGASDDAAELEGYGVVDAHTARGLAAAAPTWQRLWTDSEGVPVKLGRTAYRPPDSLRRFIRYRDGACRVPGCMRAARRAEIDHTVEWQDGGSTDADNLALLCPKHHALKSLALFTLGRRASGDLVWTTLLGFGHPSEPSDRDHILGPRSADLPVRPGELSQPSGPPLPPEPGHRPPPEQRPEEPPPF